MLKVLGIALRVLGLLMLVPIILFLIPIAAQFVEGAHRFELVKQSIRITQPVNRTVQQNVPLKIKGYETAPWMVIILAFILRGTLSNYGDRLTRQAEYRAQQQALKQLRAGLSKGSAEALKPLETQLEQLKTATKADRETLLKQFIEAKKRLEEAQKDLVFLSVDVIGSTKMKEREDKALIEYSFSEYKKFVDGILKVNNVWKVAWTPDGIMCAFPAVDDAIKAGQDIITGLEAFNKNVKQVRTDFAVRCGLNAGKVMFDDAAQMEEVSDHAIDVAGHLQKYASANMLWISKETFESASRKAGFVPIENKVDDHDVLEWKRA